jgi:hypothetical protein
MRKALFVSLISLAAAGAAYAQQEPYRDPQGQAHLNQPSANNQAQQHRDPNHPPTPTPTTTPVPRCADLAVTTLGFVSSVPGGPPLAPGEVALEYDVHNAGTSMYVAPSGASQGLSLEYSTPSGVHQVAATPLPPAPSGTTHASALGVTLAQGQSWRGYMRMTFPEAARRWPLRLRINFAQSSSPYAARISDCDPDNDEVVVPRSQLPPPQPAG